MEQAGVHAVQLVFLLLLLFVVAFGALARKLRVPYPIVLVIAGTILAVIPGIPRIALNPDVIFFVILPPLLYNAAWLTSWREFRFNLISILFLAFGLVAFTVVGIALGAPFLFSGFTWKAGLLLGAVVAPTDALAATSIAQKVGLPRQITHVLEGESLVNDATGLLALEFGIAMLIYDQRPTIASGAWRLLFLTIAGIAIGLITGWLVDWIERRIDDGPIEIALSILVPYAAYFIAEEIHASGVLAVVACGLYLARRSSGFFSPGVRLQAWAVWDSLGFILNGLVFILIGLQLHYVLLAIKGYSPARLAWYAGLFSLLLVALRMLWVFPGAHLAYAIRRKVGHQAVATPSNRGILVVGWTGMRGGIALAAAISLPQTMAGGQPFAQRNLIVFLAYSVILVTLVLQGLTLPWLVQVLGLANAKEENPEEEMARRQMLESGFAFLEGSRQKLQDDEELLELYQDLSEHYRHRLTTLGGAEAEHAERHRNFTQLIRGVLDVERQTAVRLRNEGKINDETLHTLERELDLRQASVETRGHANE